MIPVKMDRSTITENKRSKEKETDTWSLWHCVKRCKWRRRVWSQRGFYGTLKWSWTIGVVSSIGCKERSSTNYILWLVMWAAFKSRSTEHSNIIEQMQVAYDSYGILKEFVVIPFRFAELLQHQAISLVVILGHLKWVCNSFNLNHYVFSLFPITAVSCRFNAIWCGGHKSRKRKKRNKTHAKQGNPTKFTGILRGFEDCETHSGFSMIQCHNSFGMFYHSAHRDSFDSKWFFRHCRRRSMQMSLSQEKEVVELPKKVKRVFRIHRESITTPEHFHPLMKSIQWESLDIRKTSRIQKQLQKTHQESWLPYKYIQN